ncbi:MAG: DUF898 domain-containing protein [Chloroflexi bacterium]|nr:DUF898 domain-containing protein [Chloroflexota bacterium]
MKFISVFFRIIGIIILILVALALPLSLLGRAVGNLVSSPDAMLELVEQNILNEDRAADLVEEIVTAGLDLEVNTDNDITHLVFDALSDLEHDDWIEIMDEVAPTDVMVDTTREILEGFYTWMDGDKSNFKLEIDLRPWKENISSNAGDVMELVLNSLPPCTAQQTQEFSSIDEALRTGEGFPPCRPPENLYQDLIAEASREARQRMGELPDEQDIVEDLSAADLGDLKDIREQYRRARAILKWGWLLVVFLYLTAIPMGTRSIQGFFNWAGRPLLISGALTFLIAILMLLGIVALGFGVGGGILSDLPQVALPIVEGLIGSVVASIAWPLVFLGIFQLFLGGIALVIGFVIGRVWKSEETPEEQLEDEGSTLILASEEDQPDEILEDEPEEDSIEENDEDEPEEDASEEKDEDSPTGMFG